MPSPRAARKYCHDGGDTHSWMNGKRYPCKNQRVVDIFSNHPGMSKRCWRRWWRIMKLEIILLMLNHNWNSVDTSGATKNCLNFNEYFKPPNTNSYLYPRIFNIMVVLFALNALCYLFFWWTLRVMNAYSIFFP